MDRDQDQTPIEQKSRKGKEEFKCGDSKCNKLYHSYTAFYNHCKKAHNGQFPQGSLLNNEYFDGPTKNRGRPRIKKSEVKNEFQIQSMKAENQLIEFLGTIKNMGNRGNEELISYVEFPSERMEQAISIVKEWIMNEEANKYFESLYKMNEIICNNDLPEFYDPIEFEQHKDKVDSYNFSSIFKFFKDRKVQFQLEEPVDCEQMLLCWLTRILSLKLLTQTIYTLLQRKQKLDIIEKDLYVDKSARFLQLVDNYLELIQGENVDNN